MTLCADIRAAKKISAKCQFKLEMANVFARVSILKLVTIVDN